MRNCVFCLCLFVLSLISFSENDTHIIVSYNVENLFDTRHDSLKNDTVFLLDSYRHWTYERMKRKMGNLSRVISDIGSGEPPMLIALCEIENDWILKQWTRHSPLSKFRYSYIHRESNDPRGIDVALLYDSKRFTPLTKHFFSPSHFPTRDILYAKGTLTNQDTIHVFVIHAPSKTNLKNEKRRLTVMSILKHATDSIFHTNQKAKIIILGDMNETPNSTTLEQVLYARNPNATDINDSALYNLSYAPATSQAPASYCYKNTWEQLDQIIVSGALLDSSSSSFVHPPISVFSPSYLLRFNTNDLSFSPARTYNGKVYDKNGYSDHLPVYLRITIRPEKLAGNRKTH